MSNLGSRFNTLDTDTESFKTSSYLKLKVKNIKEWKHKDTSRDQLSQVAIVGLQSKKLQDQHSHHSYGCLKNKKAYQIL